MKQNIFTKKQHYVPQVYLRGFSDDSKRIWSYSLSELEKGTYVAINSVCLEKNLYELKDDNGSILLQNLIEKVLAELERTFYDYRAKLIEKAEIEENYNTRCFLTTQEKAFWKLYIAVQILRDPIVLDAVSSFAKDCWGDSLTDNQRKNFALYQCLPFFDSIKEEDKNVFNVMLQPLDKMSFLVEVDDKNSIFTSDSPVFMHSPGSEEPRIENVEQIIVPITSKIAIFLFRGQEKCQHKNCLHKLDEEELKSLKYSIAYVANNRLFSRKELSSLDIEVIKRARIDKERDSEQKGNTIP